jgi:CBS domain-containing protein
MTEQVVTVSPGLSLQQVVDDYFLTHSYAAFPVVEGGELRGIIHLRDVRAVPREEWATKRVAEAMESLAAAHTILPEADAWDAMVRMATEDQGRLIVVDASGALRGVISRSDLMQLIRTKLELGL